MTAFVALLRAVNLAGTNRLAMKNLAGLCDGLAFKNVRTYIQSGNVVFKSGRSRTAVRTALERALTKHMGKKIDVIVRDATELRQVLEANPFRDAPPAKVAVLFCSAPLPTGLFEKGAGVPGGQVVAPGGEQIVVGHQEVYIYYPDGMGRSKLKFPKTDGVVTVRNINTVTRLAAMADA
jgi:uncharacterized protein (DUF1697 family)